MLVGRSVGASTGLSVLTVKLHHTVDHALVAQILDRDSIPVKGVDTVGTARDGLAIIEHIHQVFT